MRQLCNRDRSCRGKQLNFQRNECLRKKFSLTLAGEETITHITLVLSLPEAACNVTWYHSDYTVINIQGRMLLHMLIYGYNIY